MPNVPCTNCGAKVSVPEGHTRAKIRCGACGYYADVPAEYRSTSAADESEHYAASPSPLAPPSPRERGTKPKSNTEQKPKPKKEEKSRKAKPNNNAADPRPNFESDEPSGQRLLEGDDIERDGMEVSPYAVPGTGLKKCPECRGDLPLDATLCVHCGMEIGTRTKKAKREYTPLFKEWEAYFPFDIRLKAFFAMQGLNVLCVVFTAVVSGSFDLFAAISFLIVQGAVQAFLVGTYEKITIKRNAKGKTEITKYWRFFFYPTPPQKIDWKVSHGTALIPTHNPGPLEWGMMVYLLLFGCLPGILFYWFVIHPERYDIVLCDLHGSTDQAIFRTTKRDLADEICRTINEATTLTYRPVV